MKCFGCFKEDVDGFCYQCRKKLFDGRNVPHVLPFKAPENEGLLHYNDKIKRLSISGVQLKYSLKLEKKELVFTEKNGQYILKPIPPTSTIVMQDQAPANEHLTMQIADQLFNIPVAFNALMQFKDGPPAYITRRFDLKPDGTKYLQEDFAQISGKTTKNDGPHYKYNSTYEDIGKLIRQKVAAYPSVLESFFRLVLFNYIFSNGDAHLKNFSLIQTDFGDHIFSKAYDLLSTVLHSPAESDTALDLYEGDYKSPFYEKYGYFGRPDFEEFATRIGVKPGRAKNIIHELLGKQQQVQAMIKNSFLSKMGKEKYTHCYLDKVRRFLPSKRIK